METVARIMTDSIPHPITGRKSKCYYHLYRHYGKLYIDTAWKEPNGFLNHSIRQITNAKVAAMRLRDLSSARACEEIARAITDINSMVKYTSKSKFRCDIIADARYFLDPYKCSFVDKQQIVRGTIVDIYYDLKNETNAFRILPEDAKGHAVVTKFQGEINMPYMSWRKFCE